MEVEMRVRTLILLLCLYNLSIYADSKSIILPELVNPDSIAVDQNRLFITEGTSILIFDLTNLKLIKKFGKRGEGPKEFMVNRQSGNPPLNINVDTHEIIVNSKNKVSFFSKDGEYKRETKVSTSSGNFVPFMTRFAGETLTTEEGKRYWLIELFNEELKKIKELTRIKHHFQGLGKGFKVLQESRLYKVSKDKLFVACKKGFHIEVYNSRGNKLHTISSNYEKKPVSQQDKNDIIKYFKTSPSLKEIYPLLKPIIFPDFYPAIRSMLLDAGKIYIITYKKNNLKTECLVLDSEGKLLRTIFMDLHSSDIFVHYPYTIKRGKLYQLVETIDEEWQLLINEI
jgi:hypothetical protein